MNTRPRPEEPEESPSRRSLKILGVQGIRFPLHAFKDPHPCASIAECWRRPLSLANNFIRLVAGAKSIVSAPEKTDTMAPTYVCLMNCAWRCWSYRTHTQFSPWVGVVVPGSSIGTDVPSAPNAAQVSFPYAKVLTLEDAARDVYSNAVTVAIFGHHNRVNKVPLRLDEYIGGICEASDVRTDKSAGSGTRCHFGSLSCRRMHSLPSAP